MYDMIGSVETTATVYTEIGFDGKSRKYICGNGYYKKIYKQYSRPLYMWVTRLNNLLIKTKYNGEQIKNIINHCYKKGYYVTNNYYIKPDTLVQRVLELGYSNLECV